MGSIQVVPTSPNPPTANPTLPPAPSIAPTATPAIDAKLTPKINDRVQSEGMDRDLNTVKVSNKISSDSDTARLGAQLNQIEQKYGVKIGTVPSTTVWAEDPGIALGRNGYLAVNFNRDGAVSSGLTALSQYNLPNAVGGQGRTASTGNGTRVSEGELTAQQMLDAGYQVQQSKVFLEGGNVLATGGKVLVGKSSIIVSMATLDQRGELDPRQVQQLAQSRNWSKEELDEAKTMAANMRSSTGKPAGSATEIDSEARTILAKMELTKEVIAKELNVKPRDIVAVSQPTFHIDMQMRPLENGVIMVNDPRLANKMIDDVLNDKSVTLSQEERDALKDMKWSQEALDKLCPVLDKARKELEAAGFKVISAPGNSAGAVRETFTDSKGTVQPYREVSMNNMNGTIGRTPSGTNLYLTNSSGIPALDAAQAKWLTANTSIQAVEFMDHELLYRDGGWDCITVGQLPTTAPNTPKPLTNAAQVT